MLIVGARFRQLPFTSELIHRLHCALDGVSIRIRKPSSLDCVDPASYFHRKGYYAIPVQAIYDSKYKFLFMSEKCPGPTHDLVAFNISSYAEKLHDGLLGQGLWLAADDAYVCTENIITPLSREECMAGSASEAFNFSCPSIECISNNRLVC